MAYDGSDQEPSGSYGGEAGGAIAAVLGTVGQLIASNQQETSAEHAAQHQYDLAKAATDAQNLYNSPAEQLKRFKDAGLNPNLIYGQGSAGNQPSATPVPSFPVKNLQSLMQFLPLFNQTRLVSSQVQATDAKTVQTTQLTELNKMQTKVLSARPELDSEGFKAMIDGLKATAAMKQSQVTGQNIANFVSDASAGWRVDFIKKQTDWLDARLKMAGTDAKIKDQILNSKEFQNAILEKQKEFMVDGKVDAQHIYSFITLLLQKLL